jgi:hypothetical protein
MAGDKAVYFPHWLPGQTGTYSKVRQEATGYLLDNTDGVFKAVSVDPKIPLTEDTNCQSIYYFIENRNIWPDGEYYAFAYSSSDFLFSVACFSVVEDIEVIRADVYNAVRRTLGLIHENFFIDQTVYNSDSNLISARVRTYKSAADVGTNSGVLATYMITADPDGPLKFNFWRQGRI